MKLLTIGLVVAVMSLRAGTARAECDCLAIAAEVSASVQGAVIRADNLFAKGDVKGALALYAQAYAAGDDAVLLFAQGMAQWHLGASAEAKAMFEAYLAADADGAYAARARAALDDLDAGVVATAGGVVGGVVGGVGGVVGGVGGAVGGVGGAVGGGGDVNLRGALGDVTAKPKKVAKGAAIVLGIVAVVAVGAVAVQGISAGLDDAPDATFDKRFGLGMGLSGVVVGATAVYLWGLTTAVGAAGGVCAADARPVRKPVVVPQVYRGGGGGLAAAMTF